MKSLLIAGFVISYALGGSAAFASPKSWLHSYAKGRTDEVRSKSIKRSTVREMRQRGSAIPPALTDSDTWQR